MAYPGRGDHNTRVHHPDGNTPGPNPPGGTLDRGVHTSEACTYVVLPSNSSGPIVLCLYACTSSPRLLDPTITTATTQTDLETSPARLLIQLFIRTVLVNFSKSISFIIVIFYSNTAATEPFSQEEKSHSTPAHTFPGSTHTSPRPSHSLKQSLLSIMCDYTQVEFRCGHVRYTVRAWCTNYETTHKRCPPSVVAIEFR
jgi:hypothetical protein